MADECAEILDKLETYLDGECRDGVEQVVAAHIDECPPCMQRADFERALRHLVATRCRQAAPTSLIAKVRAQFTVGDAAV